MSAIALKLLQFEAGWKCSVFLLILSGLVESDTTARLRFLLNNMPLYFFNVYDGYSSLDQDGTELPDIYTAQNEAIRLSGEILREEGGKFWNDTEWRLEIADISGAILFILRFSAQEILK